MRIWNVVKCCLCVSVAIAALEPLVATAQVQPVRVMPFGDSLTSSISGQASYRYYLWKRLAQARMPVDFVGTLWGMNDGSSGIYADFDQDHEGHAGATTADLLEGAAYFATQNYPEVVLLLAGGTDCEQGLPPADAVENIKRIVQVLRQVNPDIKIILSTLPNVQDAAERARVRTFNSTLLRQARTWSTARSPVRVVDLYSTISPTRDTVDGIHFNASGEKKVASRFYGSLAPVLSKIYQAQRAAARRR